MSSLLVSLRQIPKYEIFVALFKKKAFREIIGRPFPKQEKAFELLTNDKKVMLLYGGAAGGGKSYLGWLWLILSCLAYPKTEWFFARRVLKEAMLYGLQTFREVVDNLGLPADKYSINFNSSYIRFYHNSSKTSFSTIYLIGLQYKYDDPEYQGLGSRLYTGGFGEEMGQLNSKESVALEILWIRCGRNNNALYDLEAKFLLASNPSKNILFGQFYLPHKNGNLEEPYKYIHAKVTDNPFQRQSYIEQLANLKNPIQKQRMYYGNWEYADDETALFVYEKLQNLFTNTHTPSGAKRIVVDVAGDGQDKTVLMVADGLRIIDVSTQDKSDINTIKELIEQKKHQYAVPNDQIIVDAGGGWQVHNLIGCKGFNGAHKSTDPTYPNKKTQCVYKLKRFINESGLFIDIANPELKETIIQQLSAFRRDKIDKDDGKLYVNSKDDQKKLLGGKSPDYADCLLMLMAFFLDGVLDSPYYHSFNLNNHVCDEEIDFKLPIYTSIISNVNFGYYVLLTQKKSDTFYHLDCQKFNEAKELGKHINELKGKVHVNAYFKSQSQCSNQENNANRVTFNKIKEILPSAQRINTFRYNLQNADKFIHKLYAGTEKVQVKISSSCDLLTQDKLRCTKTHDNKKSYTNSMGFVSDLEQHFFAWLIS